MISFNSYCVSYDKKRVLNISDFTIKQGKTYAIIGPSGCGKTTMAYSIANLLPSNALISGVCENKELHSTAVVLQEYGLFPWKSVYDNIALPLVLKHENPEIIRNKVLLVLEQLGIKNQLKSYPHELSGGQKQRTAIARALLTDSNLIILDEPFSSLDTITRENLQDDLKVLIIENAKTMVLVTHDIEEAVYLAEVILVMNNAGELSQVFNNACYVMENQRETELFYKNCIKLRKYMKEDF